MKSNDFDNIMAWVSGQAFTTGVLAFSLDLVKALMLGLVGGLGGYLAKKLIEMFKEW